MKRDINEQPITNVLDLQHLYDSFTESNKAMFANHFKDTIQRVVIELTNMDVDDQVAMFSRQKLIENLKHRKLNSQDIDDVNGLFDLDTAKEWLENQLRLKWPCD